MYTLELELFSSYVADVPEFEIWADGVLLGGTTYSVTSGGFSVFVSPSYGGSLPTSLEFHFDDVSVEAPRSIEIRSVKINDQYVNTGNYLSSNTLINGGSSIVDIDSVNTDDSDFIFDDSEPAASEFITGATNTFTAGVDFHNNYNGTTDEVFNMLAGSDYAYTGSGDDKISGGSGNDTLRGGSGNDLIFGGADNDRLFGMNDDDIIYGGTGNDTLFGNNGNDELHGGDGNDKINGHSGDDILTGGIGEDQLNGSSGVDFLFGGADNDTLLGGAGNDTLDGGAGEDLIYGGANDDIINGGDDNDILIGNIGVDEIYGDDGDDTIYIMTNDWSAGEAIYGGAGTDELILSHASTIDFTTGTLETLETLTGSNGDQDVTIEISQLGQFTSVDLSGHTSGDTIRTQIDGVYDAVIDGAPTVTNVENGFLVGSANADTLTVSGVQLNSLIYGSGIINMSGDVDTLNITSTSTTLNTLGANDGSILGLETINASTAVAPITIDMNAQTEDFTIMGGLGSDNITGGSGDDTISSILTSGNYDFDINGATETLYVDYDGTDHWILVGRGREGWDFDTNGQGVIANMSVGLGTTAAFAPVAYDDAFVNDIIDSITVSGDLTDVETRIKRSANITGTEYQEVRWNAVTETDWTFDFDGGGQYNVTHEVSASVLGSAAGSVVEDTRDTNSGSANNHERIFTWAWGSHASQRGFAYGSAVGGTNGNSASTFLWENGTENHAVPYAEIYIRLDSASFDSTLGDDVIDGGTGNDTIIENLGNDTIDGGIGNDTIFSGVGADILNGGIGSDIINAGADNDIISLANGDFSAGESIDGGADNDELILTNATTIDFTIGSLSNIENLTGSVGDDDITIDVATLNQFTSIDLAGGSDVLRINSTSAGLNALNDGDLLNLEEIDASTSVAHVAIDLSDQSEDFTVLGSNSTLIGADNHALEFAGGNDTVNLSGLSVDTTANAKTTVEFWMDWDGTNNIMPFGFQTYDLWFSNNKFGFNNGSSLIYGISSVGLANTPVHVAAVFTDSDTLSNKLYINGVEQTISILQGSINNGNAQVTSNAQISGWGANASYKFDGTIDELRIWDGERTSTEINSNMDVQITGPQTNLIANYNFESVSDGAGGVTDTSGNAHNGTLSGMTAAANVVVRNDILTLLGGDVIETGAGDDTITAGDGNDTIFGGAGNDMLSGGNDADTFIFESTTAFGVANIDDILDFSTADDDALDLSDLISGFSGTITDYLQFTTSGSDTIVQVDGNGLTGGSSFQTIASLNGVTGLDENTLFVAGNIIV